MNAEIAEASEVAVSKPSRAEYYRKIITRSGLKMQHVAKEIGINRSILSLMLHGHKEWTDDVDKRLKDFFKLD